MWSLLEAGGKRNDFSWADIFLFSCLIHFRHYTGISISKEEVGFSQCGLCFLVILATWGLSLDLAPV